MTGVFFLSHLYNDFTLEQYNRLKKSLLDDMEFIWVYDGNIPKSFFLTNNINSYFHFTRKDNFIDNNNNNHTNNLQIYLDIYKNYEYEYYWFIEYDVTVNNQKHYFKTIFNYYHENMSLVYKTFNYLNRDHPIYEFNQKNADLICDHLETYNTNSYYRLRYPYEYLKEKYSLSDINENELLFGFLPICRLSNKFLNILSNKNEYHDCFFEWIIPTLAQKNNLKIVSFKNIFTFDIYFIFYPNYNYYINRGTNSWTNMNIYRYNKNLTPDTIIHPIKNKHEYDRLFKSINNE